MAFGKKNPVAAHKVNVYRLCPTAAQRAVLRDLGDRVSALWNAANYRCRQNYLAHLGVPGYTELCSTLISDPNYRRLPSDIAQEVLAKLTEAWTSYFALLERYHHKEVSDKPGLPKYRKNKDGTRPANLIVIKHPRSYRITPQSVDLSLPPDLRTTAGRLLLDHRGIRRWNGRDGRVEIVFDQSDQKVASAPIGRTDAATVTRLDQNGRHRSGRADAAVALDRRPDARASFQRSGAAAGFRLPRS
jgi:putative transposase